MGSFCQNWALQNSCNPIHQAGVQAMMVSCRGEALLSPEGGVRVAQVMKSVLSGQHLAPGWASQCAKQPATQIHLPFTSGKPNEAVAI